MATTPSLEPTYGAMFIGLLFATFLQGVLSVQVYHYYENYSRDSLWMKVLVAVVWVLDLVHLVMISKALFYYLVSNWGNPESLLYATPELDLHLIFVALATVLCQFFFINRIWVFSSKNIVLTGFLVAGCLVTFVLELIKTSVIYRGDRSVALFRLFKGGVIALFSSSAAVDVIMAGLMAFYLTRNRDAHGRLRHIIARLIQYTIATGALTSMLAISALIAYMVNPKSDIFIAIHFSVGRMYTNALLVTLNARRKLREAPMENPKPPAAFSSRSQPHEISVMFENSVHVHHDYSSGNDIPMTKHFSLPNDKSEVHYAE